MNAKLQVDFIPHKSCMTTVIVNSSNVFLLGMHVTDKPTLIVLHFDVDSDHHCFDLYHLLDIYISYY